jgi:hypothetical protein
MKNNHPDFDLYRKQQEYQRDWQDVATLKKDGGEAWTLDKYKFLHLVVKVWHERPNINWYVFIEADTYVVWSNLVLWLQQLSAADKLYLGSAAWLGPQAFAHGGSGYVFSGTLLQQFVDGKSDLASRYDDVFPNYCCGDAVLAQILKQELDIDVKNYWPQLNGEKPSTMAFGSVLWCQPVITMHHITPRERSAIFEFEQSRKNQMVRPFEYLSVYQPSKLSEKPTNRLRYRSLCYSANCRSFLSPLTACVLKRMTGTISLMSALIFQTTRVYPYALAATPV